MCWHLHLRQCSCVLTAVPVLSTYSWWKLPFHSGWHGLKSWLLWNQSQSVLHFSLSWVAQSGVQLSGGCEPWAFSISLEIMFLGKKANSWASETELSCWEINNVWMFIRSSSKELSCKAAGNAQILELNHRFLQIKHYTFPAFARGTDSGSARK